MTCVNIGNGIICFSREANHRLKIGNKYIFFEFHEYMGPAFFTDVAHTKVYDPIDENDPIWEPFEEWLKKRNDKLSRRNKRRYTQLQAQP